MFCNMSKRLLFVVLIVLVLAPILTLAANDPLTQAQQIATKINLPTNNSTPQDIILNSIRYFLTFIGLVLTASIIYAGFQWILSNGESDKIDKAKSRLKYSILGLVIILAGYSIVLFVNRVVNIPTRQETITVCTYDPNNVYGYNGVCSRVGKNYYCSAQGNCLLDATK